MNWKNYIKALKKIVFVSQHQWAKQEAPLKVSYPEKYNRSRNTDFAEEF